MYSLIAIFSFIPLYFSHIFAPFGVIIWESSSFERQKVLLFTLLVIGAFMELVWSHYNEMMSFLVSRWKLLIALLIFPFVSYAFWGAQYDVDFFLGSYEKYHGYIFFLALIFLGFLLQLLAPSEKKILIRASLIGGILVSSFALLESMGASVFFESQNHATWWSGRSISTLGNPNYVAGYLLILLPFVSSLSGIQRLLIATIFVMAILSTKSYIAIFLMVLYGVWIFLGSMYPSFWTEQREVKNPGARKTETWILHPKSTSSLLLRACSSGWRSKIRSFLTLIVACSMVISGYFLLSPDKLLSLTSRFVLMRETLAIMMQYPLSWSIGFGPDSLVRAYDFGRSALIDSYFPKGSAIDSSHNIFIDILFQFGGIFLGFAIYVLSSLWKRLPTMSQEWIVLWLIFLSLNPYILLHVILLIFLSSLHVTNS